MAPGSIEVRICCLVRLLLLANLYHQNNLLIIEVTPASELDCISIIECCLVLCVLLYATEGLEL